MVDGIIVSLCDYKKNKDIYERLQREHMPMVFFDRIPHQMNMTQVIVDDYIKSFFLVEKLIRSGRKRIIHLQGSDAVYNAQERMRGYRDAMNKFHLTPISIKATGLSFSNGAKMVDELIDSGNSFDAIFAFTDTLAIGALNRLREVGLNVPNDVAVASFSGTLLATIVNPSLTTVEPPLRQMGSEAAALILEKINNPESPTRTVVLDAEMVIRGSI